MAKHVRRYSDEEDARLLALRAQHWGGPPGRSVPGKEKPGGLTRICKKLGRSKSSVWWRLKYLQEGARSGGRKPMAGKHEITGETRLTGPLAEALLKHAKDRQREPVELLADIVETVLRENLVDAVLDDRP